MMTNEKFHLLPFNAVVTAVDTVAEAAAIRQALTQAGFVENQINTLYGPEGEDFLDLDGSRHGYFTKMIRQYQGSSGPEARLLEQGRAALQHNRTIVSVKTDGSEEERVKALTAIAPHTSRTIFYCGKLTITILKVGQNYGHETEYEESLQTNQGEHLL